MNAPIAPSAPDTERNIELDFLRATEIAALNTLQWLGKGDKEAAEAAAYDATGTIAITHSVLMRARSGSVRFIETRHDLQKRPYT